MWDPFIRLLEVVLFTFGGVYQGLRQDWNILEVLIIGVLALLWRKGRIPQLSFAAAIERWGARIARKRWRICFAAAAGAVAIRLALLPLHPVPQPVVADEFSHLLLAGTLLEGRAANPVHPFWPHFESLHILQTPKYVSNYFPGQGVVLAAGMRIFGDAWWGVLALSAIFTGALCWALQGWMPPRWALLGALIAALRFGVSSYWIDGYHGGFLAAAGGALVAGSYARLRRQPSFWMSAVFGAGLVMLAASRPLEGLAFSSVFVLSLLFRRGRVRSLGPALAVTALGLTAIGAYFYRITGSPFVTPYHFNQQQYGWPMTFAWAAPPPVEHRHQEMRFFYEHEIDEQAKVNGPIHFLQFLSFRVQEYWRFFFGPVLTGCLFWCAWVFRRARFRVLLAALAACAAAVMVQGAASPHYLAPAVMPLIALLVLSIARMRRSVECGPALARVAIGVIVLVLVCRTLAQAAGLPYTQKVNYQSWCCKVPGRTAKFQIAARLMRDGGRHLVLVKAKNDPYNFFQWIYNAPDIDNSAIVWARDLGEESNRALLDYYRGRTVWEVDPNPEPATIRKLR